MKQKKRTGRRLLSFLLTLVMVMGLLPGMSLTAHADGSVTYLDADGNIQTLTEAYNEVTNENGLKAGWNVVKSGTVSISRQSISGDVNLILCDDTQLTVDGRTSNALYTYGGGSLTIYAQSTGNNMGELVASSNNNYTINTDNGNITINGGKVTATASGSNSSCIAVAAWGNVTINGGIIKATGYKNGILASYGNNVEINGGTVTAQATQSGAISGTVKNKIAGVGWANVDDSGDGTTIAVNETGQTLSYKRVQFKASSHTHDFT